ncbi:MAG: PLP-dependent aminotransferase family protein [Chloroflexota bacterium]
MMHEPSTDHFLLTVVHLQRESETPLYRQLYNGLRQAILEGQLAPGARLPSSRDLADLLGVSRNTVLGAFDQLLAEGYLKTRVGSGTYVTERLPEAYVQAYRRRPERAGREGAADSRSKRSLSQRGRAFAAHFRGGAGAEIRPLFAINRPDLDAFPFDVWSRLAARCLKELPRSRFGYGRGEGGLRRLQEAIAGYLRAARAARCEPEQIFVVAGSQQALFLAAQVLLDRGDAAWLENPGYRGAWAALACADAQLLPAPVDGEGLNVEQAQRVGEARLAYVTPSHQFPLGYTMSLARRTQLLQWAEANDAWIIEDDYDSEFRYSGAPLGSLQGLDVNQRVIYVGTFSKVLFPGLRLGYLIVPPDLIGAFTVARGAMTLSPPVLAQAVLARFMEEGHFARHIRRTRTRYGRRCQALVTAIEESAAGALQSGPSEAGLHLTAWLPPGTDEQAVREAAAARDVTVTPLSAFCLEPLARPGLVLGFGSAPVDDIRGGVQRLAQAVDEARKRRE